MARRKKQKQVSEAELTQALWIVEHATNPQLRQRYLERCQQIVKALEKSGKTRAS